MAYGIMGSMSDSRMLTYRTTKNVKVVCFDGTSASLINEGTVAQMVLLYNGTEKIPKRGGWGPPGGGHGPPGHGDGHRPPGHGGGGERKLNDDDDDDDDDGIDDEPPRQPPPGHWNPLQDEYFRARGLCKWLQSRGLGGPGWGYEGIVRMNAGFEVIWCDFDSPSLKLVSNLNVSAPLLESPEPDLFRGPQSGVFHTQQAMLRTTEDEGPHGPSMTNPREPFRASATWFWFAAAAKRYFGDDRMKVDACGIFSFYEDELRNQSGTRNRADTARLNLTVGGKWESPEDDSLRKAGLDQLTTRRRQHRLDSVEESDGGVMLQAVEARLTRSLHEDGCSSGTNWHHMSKEIVRTYSNELRALLQHLSSNTLRSSGEEKDIRTWLESTRALTHWFLTPFLEYPPGRPYSPRTLESLFSLDSHLAQTTLARCQTQYDTETETDFSAEDTVLYTSIKDTLSALCSTVVEIGLGVEYHWLLHLNTLPSSSSSSSSSTHLAQRRREPYDRVLHDDAQTWKKKLEELMAWLGWAEQWTGVKQACANGNVAYVPMWPVSGSERRPGRPPGRGRGDDGGGKAVEAPPSPPPRMGWGESRFLWNVVCVNATSYPPEQWE
ncbi:hypothetical protein K504DRAFT_403134 [Pleomassaria siparia CBS 279.74]|uniref:Uncharacterized protein n=1 Tax=Pleomassaria siparia CBS 279.74 TaxID=1314801 RepID=A0A6G1KHE4_9PLEO|nr:hypothetical protein K504DRAFT_403134 [Pleomassaria siparia CBS 279.74]